MPDHWDAEAIKALAEGFGGAESLRRHVEEAPVYCGDGWDGACAKDECEVVAQVQLAATLARRAFREGLERARGIALDVAGEYPEDIFRPIEWGEVAAMGPLADRIGAQMARVAARNIAAAIRREIERRGGSQANSPTL